MDGRTHARRWWIWLVLSLSLVVITLDATVVNVALPTIVRKLHATASELQWIVDAYILVYAGLLLTLGALGDRYGRKLVLNAGLVFFVLSSVAAAFAGSAGTLIAARAAMGIGGAVIMPSTLSIITNVFPDEERGRAIGGWAAIAGLGIALGPAIGGWLLEHFWWGSVFFVNVPVVTMALLAGAFLLPQSRDPHATPLDPVGALLSIAGLSALVYAIIEAPNDGWTDGVILGAFAAAAVILLAFVWWELRTQHPMLRMGFFRDPRFSAASASITLVFFALFGTIFVITQYLQFVLGYTPLQAGARILPVAAIVVGAPLSARLVERIGTKAVVAAGLVIVAAGLAVLASVDTTSGYGLVALALPLIGFGMGNTMAPATDSIMGSLPLAKAGVGSAMNDTTRMVGGALGVAVIGSALSSAYATAIQPAVAGLPPAVAGAASNSIGAAAGVAARMGPAGQGLVRAASSAFVDAMGTALWVAVGVALFGALVAAAFLPARPRRQVHVAPEEPALEAATR